MKMKALFVLILVSMSSFIPSAFAVRPSENDMAKMISVAAYFGHNTITLDIYGENFTDGDEEPEVTVGGIPATVFSDSWTAEYVTVDLPLVAPGDYLLVLTNHEGEKSEYGLTIGAVGPQGPQGVPGEPGEAGATGSQGPQGIQGERGPLGPQGATGLQGPQGIPGEPSAPGGPVGPCGPKGPRSP